MDGFRESLWLKKRVTNAVKDLGTTAGTRTDMAVTGEKLTEKVTAETAAEISAEVQGTGLAAMIPNTDTQSIVTGILTTVHAATVTAGTDLIKITAVKEGIRTVMAMATGTIVAEAHITAVPKNAEVTDHMRMAERRTECTAHIMITGVQNRPERRGHTDRIVKPGGVILAVTENLTAVIPGSAGDTDSVMIDPLMIRLHMMYPMAGSSL